MLCGRSRMQCNGARPRFFADETCVDKGQQLVVDPHSELARDGYRILRSGRNCLRHNRAQQILFQGNRSTTATSCHFWRRAAKVDVNVINSAFTTEQVHRALHHVGIAAIQLQRPKRLVRSELQHRARLATAMHQSGGHNHFVDVHKAGAELAAQRAKRLIRDSRHWGKHHRWPHAMFAQHECLEINGHGIVSPNLRFG